MTRSTVPCDASPPAPNRVKAILGACSGNLVEWYDFFIYAYTAIYFAAAFFPKGDTTTQLLATAGVFAVGFFMRPGLLEVAAAFKWLLPSQQVKAALKEQQQRLFSRKDLHQ